MSCLLNLFHDHRDYWPVMSRILSRATLHPTPRSKCWQAGRRRLYKAKLFGEGRLSRMTRPWSPCLWC